MKYFLDTEFIDDGREIDLISIGIVAEDGRTFYAINSSAKLDSANKFVEENVMPLLEGRDKGFHFIRAHIALLVQGFIAGTVPEFWGWKCSYDWVAFCQLFGPVSKLPPDCPYFINDIRQLWEMNGREPLPSQKTPKHHALNDALWAKSAYESLMARADA